MTRHPTRNALRFPTSNSSSTLNLTTTSPTSPDSPRHLYADTFIRDTRADERYSRGSRSGKPRHKNMRNMIGATTEDEFDALPITVRWKYFSTLERLRFAQNSSPIFFDDQTLPVFKKRSLVDRKRLRSPLVDTSRHNSLKKSPGRRLRQGARPPSASTADASWFLTLPDKIRKREFTEEEQQSFGCNRRSSVILDAADEAIYKPNRRATRNMTSLSAPAMPSSPTMDQISHEEMSRPTSITKAMLDSFHWMDEDSNLDLRLVLDDYHANLDGAVLPSPSNERRPSFRRHMSVSKIPFGRTSTSSINRNTPSPPTAPQTTHARKKSSTMSVMAPKHAASQSVASIDPRATHYQDPEARLKLRVYLASPQKFDEAIEFGFPSKDGLVDGTNKENSTPRRQSSDVAVGSPSKNQTFFNDDNLSLASADDASTADTASPLTPKEVEEFFKPPQRPPSPQGRPSTDFKQSAHRKLAFPKRDDQYTQSIAGAREMTLRMTLTRPDLRADESAIYGWQNGRVKSPRSPLSDEPMTFETSPEKGEMMKGPFGGSDGWGTPEKDNGVVRRLWNRVKSSQRKSS